MRDQYMRSGAEFVIVIDTRGTGWYGARKSTPKEDIFGSARCFHDQILRVKDADWAPVVVVATKCDMTEKERAFTFEGARRISVSCLCLPALT